LPAITSPAQSGKTLGESENMDTRVKIGTLPLSAILDRYLAQGFLRIFAITLLWNTAIFVIVEFFDIVGVFISADATIWTIIRYFFYKIPVSMSRVIGFATLFSTLFSLGMLARTQEITAMRSSGISVQRIALPILILSGMIYLFTFFWNETLVPSFAHQAQTIYRTEIRKRQQKSLFGTADIWMRGEGSFVNVDNFDVATNTLHGVTVFVLNRDFSLGGLIEIPVAKWDGVGWKAERATGWMISKDGKFVSQNATDALPITDSPEDLKLLARDADEFTFFDLRKQIADMRSKGLDATRYEVDLQSKLALPLISPLVVLIAIPFALKKQMSGSMALSFGVAMIISFGYWVLAAFCISLGHSAVLPPWISAWLPNTIFLMIGLFFFTAEE
jgi:lipopolysaccharide export system permease protein